MRKYLYKALFVFLRILVYLKRALELLLTVPSSIVGRIFDFAYNAINLRLYKTKSTIKKLAVAFNGPLNSQFVKIFTTRQALQFFLFLLILFMTIPHSRIYEINASQIPGHQTLLYRLVGPGEQDFQLEEVIQINELAPLPKSDSWKQGAVTSQPLSQGNAMTITHPPELAGVSTGGTAVTKPIIIPGATLPTASGKMERAAVVYHEVKSGETVSSIAQNYGISIATILWSNNLTARSYIRPGDKLKILPTSGVVHKVKRGDTLAKIAKLYSTELEKIIKANKLKEDGSDIVIGEELLIPGGVIQAPKPVYIPTTRRYTQLSSVAAPPPSISAPAGSGYLWPASVRHITQYFGWRHTGLDIAGPTGSAIYATKNGSVIRSQCGWNGGYGCYIILDHGNGIQTLYAHISHLYVSAGEQVLQGQTIATIGSTGRSTGPHLHFEVRVNGRMQNPLRYIR